MLRLTLWMLNNVLSITHHNKIKRKCAKKKLTQRTIIIRRQCVLTLLFWFARLFVNYCCCFIIIIINLFLRGRVGGRFTCLAADAVDSIIVWCCIFSGILTCCALDAELCQH